jgi:RNA exonuclease 4
MLQGRVLVGHSLSKDMKVLMLGHPRRDVRDTAK